MVYKKGKKSIASKYLSCFTSSQKQINNISRNSNSLLDPHFFIQHPKSFSNESENFFFDQNNASKYLNMKKISDCIVSSNVNESLLSYYKSNHRIVPKRNQQYQSLGNLSNYSHNIDSINNCYTSIKGKIESSKSIKALIPTKNAKSNNRNSIRLNTFQRKYDKFGNQLPVWVKPETENAKFETKPYNLDISKVAHIIPNNEGHIKTGAPQFLRKLAPVIKRGEGQYAQLQLEISGIPEPQVTWFKDNMHVKNSPDTRIFSKFGIHTLVIPEVFDQDSGIYKALITSPLGILESCSHLIVEGVFK